MSLFDDLPPPRPPRPPARPETAAPLPAAPPVPAGPEILTVSGALAAVKRTLAEAHPEVWVRGEIAGFKHHANGHMYFALKDADAMLDCAFLSFQQRGLRFRPQDGMEVEARGAFDLYAPRGRFQLRVLEMRPAGIGALLVAFEETRRRLAAEGLFDPARKRPLPRFPRSIGLVTSPSGAAIRDLVHVLRRRWPGLRLVLAPVPVQGPGSAATIAAAIRRMNDLGGLDLLIVGRGGGSLEDLWAFNEEVLVRAIAASRLPVVSAVGHEVDTTLADFAADLRAATPSAAAELVTTPTRAEVARDVRRLRGQAAAALEARLDRLRERLERARGRYGFRRADDLVAALAQRLDGLADRLVRCGTEAVRRARAEARGLARRVHPGRLLERVAAGLRHRGVLAARLSLACQGGHAVRRQRVAAARARLFALSPRAVLARGYSLVTLPDGTVVQAASELRPGLHVALEFARGRAGATITSIAPEGAAEER
jgi:exodeoxyribonuclease VII large subunit